MAATGDFLWCLVGVMASALLTGTLLYVLHGDLYHGAWELCQARVRRRVTEDDGAAMQQQPTADDRSEPDVLEYTTPGNNRVRILHPQTKEALLRLREFARRDATLLTQVTVTSSAQYPNVSPETPLLVNTYVRGNTT